MELFINEQIEKLCSTLRDYSVTERKEITDIEYTESGYRGSEGAPKDGWQHFHLNTVLSGTDKHYWFRFNINCENAGEHKKRFLKFQTGREGTWDAINPQGLVFINGKATQGIDVNHTELLLDYDKAEVLLYFYTGMDKCDIKLSVMLETVDDRILGAMYDFYVPYGAMMCFKKTDENYIALQKQLEIAADMIDLREPYSYEFYKTLGDAAEYLKNNLYGGICGNSTNTVNCIGHTHIDVAWLWTLAQTREKAQRSFATVLKLMDEYPEFLFMSSQPQLYEYVKESSPELYERIKKRVEEGRFEPEGAMWLEADCNLTSGESLVRQIIHGKRFFKEEFGIDNKVLWMPDVFGYSASMPQILKKSGIEHFVTSKISWNQTNTIPYDTFMWQGIDGSEVFTNFITTQEAKPGGETECGTTYVGELKPSHILGTWLRYQQKEYNNETFITYGFGDGGGGPTREMLETQRRLKYGLPGFPKTKPAGAYETLEKIKNNFIKSSALLKRAPKWVGELYLEFHRGTYTSIAKNKRNNRECEILLQTAECAAQTAAQLLGTEYPEKKLYSAWQTVLLNQFHDILPGSSIKQVYDDCDKDYSYVRKTAGVALNNALTALADNVAATDGYLVYNQTGFSAEGIAEIDGELYETPKVPSHGYTVFKPTESQCRVKLNGLVAENDYYSLKLDKAGRIVSLYDIKNGREVFLKGSLGNELQVFEDKPVLYDNWEITYYHRQKMHVIDCDAEIEGFADNAGAGFRITKKYMHSVIKQEIRLYNYSKRIDIKNDVDWHESEQLLKAAFPFDVQTDRATFEIQFGNLQRNTHENTSWDGAKFEVCAQRYVDVSDSGYGVSLINNCKYGHSVNGSTVMLTLIKCTNYPDSESDRGEHSFTYSIYPHGGSFAESNTVREAALLNAPMLSVPVGQKSGKLANSFSAVSVDCENVVIDTVKKAYDDNETVIRLYETLNRRTKTRVNVGFKFKRAWLCDLLENPIEELAVKNGEVSLDFNNFEIVTVKLENS